MSRTIFHIWGLFAVAHAGWAGQILATIDFSSSFSTAAPGVTFTAATPSMSTLTDMGASLGPSITFNTFTATATDLSTTIGGGGQMNVQVGAGSSVTGLKTEAWSGAVRVSNSGASSVTYSRNQSLLYAVETSGMGMESVSMFAYIERINVGTGTWQIIGATSFGIGDDGTNAACSPACTGSSSYNIAAQSFADLRLHTQLAGQLSQAASVGGTVPEPTSIACVATGLGMVLLLGRRRRGK